MSVAPDFLNVLLADWNLDMGPVAWMIGIVPHSGKAVSGLVSCGC